MIIFLIILIVVLIFADSAKCGHGNYNCRLPHGKSDGDEMP
jgi:hypothetical protein